MADETLHAPNNDPTRSAAARLLLKLGVLGLVVGAGCFVGALLDVGGSTNLLIAVILAGLAATGFGLLALLVGLGRALTGARVDKVAALGGLGVATAGAAASIAQIVDALGGIGISPWGRPLRVRGAIVQAELRPGAEWAAGPTPDCSDLSDATCLALATLWHHDAQKEHSSVPAFSRLSWVLTGLGAPAELIARVHRAALEEIDHARRCFALAGGYAGAPQSAEPIPELLRAPPTAGDDPLLTAAIESLRDGCLIEDFNADVAERAAASATDPAARELAAIIARDERAHAELAWSILEWCLDRGEGVRAAVAAAAELLPTEGPRAYADDEAGLIAAADPAGLAAHGRVPAGEWAPIYARRLAATRARVLALCSGTRAAA